MPKSMEFFKALAIAGVLAGESKVVAEEQKDVARHVEMPTDQKKLKESLPVVLPKDFEAIPLERRIVVAQQSLEYTGKHLAADARGITSYHQLAEREQQQITKQYHITNFNQLKQIHNFT
jgi:hypothetical protein